MGNGRPSHRGRCRLAFAVLAVAAVPAPLQAAEPPSWQAAEPGAPRSALQWELVPAGETPLPDPLRWAAVEPESEEQRAEALNRPTTLAEAQALANSLPPSPADYPLLRSLGPTFATANVLPAGELDINAFDVTPLAGGGDANGTGNQNYVGRIDLGLTDRLQVSAFFSEADDPLFAQPTSLSTNPANLWQSFGVAAQWQLLQRDGWALALAGSLERFNVGSGGCGSGGRDGDTCSPNIFNNSGVRVYTENRVGSLSLPLSWQPNPRLEFTLVPGVSVLPSSQGSGQGGSGTFFGTNVTLGAGVRWRASTQLQFFGSTTLALGPGTNSFNSDLDYSRVPIWSAGLNYALNPRIGLQASLTNGFGGTPATAILTLPSSNQPLAAARISFIPGAADSTPLPFTSRSRSLSLGGLSVSTALVPPARTLQVAANADSGGNLYGQLAFAISNDMLVWAAGYAFNNVAPPSDLVNTYANDGSANDRFGAKAVFLHQLRGAPFSLAGAVSLGQNIGSNFQGYVFGELVATWEATERLAFNLNPKLAWTGVGTPVGLGLGANLQLSPQLQLIPELNWVATGAGDSNASLALRWLPKPTAAIDLYVSNAAGVFDIGQLLQTDQARIGAKVTLQF